MERLRLDGEGHDPAPRDESFEPRRAGVPLKRADSLEDPVGFDELTGLLSFARELVSADSVEDLAERYFERIGEFVAAPKKGLLLIDPVSQEVVHLATRGLSDYFACRYERIAARQDPLLRYVLTHRVPAASWLLMSEEQWESHPLYAEACKLHGIRTLLQTPILNEDEVVGTLFFANGVEEGKPSEHDVQVALSIGEVLGACIAAAERRDALRRARGNLVIALDRCSEAVVVTDLEAGRRHANAAARRLLAQVEETERIRCVDDLMAEAPNVREDGSHASHREVGTVSGDPAVLTETSIPASEAPSLVVSLLALEAAPRGAILVESLTPREVEVAEQVASGLSDPGIADALCLSPHTVKQHVKNIYRKLGIGSRTELTAAVVRRSAGRA